VFFDAVGTLIRPRPPVGEVYARFGREAGAWLDPPEAERRFHAAFRRQEEEDRERLWQTDEERERRRWSAIVQEVFADQPNPLGPLDDLWRHFGRPDAWAIFADVLAVLPRLSGQGLELGIASNFDGRLRQVVAGLPALGLCRHLAISSEIGWRKPSPLFFEGLRAIGPWRPAEVLLVGDDLGNDYQAALDSGLQAVLLSRDGDQRAPHTIASLEQLPDYLRGTP
jgi:putative hydrolase of the HAD superfamily